MPNITTISGASAASYNSLSYQTGWTYVASSNVPPGSAAAGYLEGAVAGTPAFQIESTQRCNATSGNDQDYWVGFWLMGVSSGTGLPSGGADSYVLASNGTFT